MNFKPLVIAAISLAPCQTIPNNVTLRDFLPGLIFSKPVFFAEVPGRDSNFVVLEQTGSVQTARMVGGVWVKSEFARVAVDSLLTQDERGLLGFAFHPQYTANRKYYLFQVPRGRLAETIVEYQADTSLIRRDTTVPARVVLDIGDPARNHNGGTIAFSPVDGFLYVGIGDGGGSGDSYNLGQNRDTLQGKILRIDVDRRDSGLAYGIPPDNPFVGQAGYRPEIWALGFRNPWKWGFHPVTGELWVGDVGQDTWEEISLVPKGGNMGWRQREGRHCYNPMTGCLSAGMTEPAHEYNQNTGGIAVIGGLFFQGDTNSPFHNVYFFGDFGNGRIYGARYQNFSLAWVIQIGSVVPRLTSFGNDSRGRVFAMGFDQGVIHILESPDMRPAPVALDPRKARKVVAGIHPLDTNNYDYFALDGRALSVGKTRVLKWARNKTGGKTTLTILP